MKKTLLLALIISSLAPLSAAPIMDDFAFSGAPPENIVINNRVLLKLNGKVITVMDVVRKMDLLFYRQFPEYTNSVAARYQFYNSAWRTVLSAVIDDALIMKDAEEKKIVVNDGEIRQELEKLFGPNVVLNLDKLGMSLDEAFTLLKTELTVQRMTSMMVHSKALTEVHPISMKERYEKTIVANPSKNIWIYQILSIRGQDHESAAQKAHALLTEQMLSLEETVAQLQKEGIEVSCSDVYRQSENDLSLSYKAALASLSLGSVSLPVSTKTVSRIFALKDQETIEPPPFKELADSLKEEITQEAMGRHNAEYRKKLREQYGVTDRFLTQTIPSHLKPFDLR